MNDLAKSAGNRR